MRGEHARLVVLAGAVADAVRDWQPPPDLADAARAAVAITMSNSMIDGGGEADGPMPSAAAPAGPRSGGDVYLSGLVRVLLAYDSVDIGSFPHRFAADAAGELRSGFPERLAELAARPRPAHGGRRQPVARSRARERRRSGRRDRGGPARHWRSSRDEDGPWSSRDAARPARRADDAPR